MFGRKKKRDAEWQAIVNELVGDRDEACAEVLRLRKEIAQRDEWEKIVSPQQHMVVAEELKVALTENAKLRNEVRRLNAMVDQYQHNETMREIIEQQSDGEM